MASSEDLIARLESAIAAQEALRPALGDGAVEPVIRALRTQLETLRAPPATPPHVPAALVPPSAERAERRQLTVMFCDLVGSTTLAEKLDPEDLRAVLRAYQESCASAIRRFDGFIAKYLGDGLLVYFGYPIAHEDDPHRAVRAGLGILEAIDSLNTRLELERGMRLAVRIGIHTGLVVAGDMGSGEDRDALAIVGETPNVAARLQDQAAPDTLVIGPATYRLVRGFFAVEPLGARILKGVSQPMEIYRVIGGSRVQSRLDVAATAGLTPLVGRDRELGALLTRWDETKAGGGQVVLLSGEAGIGKSRLMHALAEHIAEPHIRLDCRCSPYRQSTTLYPVVDLLQRRLQLAGSDTPTAKVRRLESFLADTLPERSAPDMVALLASLLSLPADERHLADISPQRQKQKTLEALVELHLALAARHPVLLLIEDLHWVDPSTLEWLDLLIQRAARVRLFLLLTARPEFVPPWPARPELMSLALGRLPRGELERMVSHLAGGKALPPEVRQQVILKTDGIPLFVEELTKMVLESGLLHEREDRYDLRSPLPELAIPTTLQDSLMARLDRLAEAKELAQLGASLGREFSLELIRAVSNADEATLERGLSRLVQAEIVYQHGAPPQAVYTFKHALVQDAAYHSLLKRTRQQYHQRIAEVLETRFPESCETQPELLAHHYTCAGLVAQATAYWKQAGGQAIRRSANIEAVRHLEKALELLVGQPDHPERVQQELALQTMLGGALINTKGWGASDVAHAFSRARTLCREVGETPQLWPALRGLTAFYFIAGDLRAARELSEEFQRLAHRTDDPEILLEADMIAGWASLWLGEFSEARAHARAALARYDVEEHRSHAFLYGQDPGVMSASGLALVLWFLGYPDQARDKSAAALAFAKTTGHPFSKVFALWCASVLDLLVRDAEAARWDAEATLMLAREQGFPHGVGIGTAVRGWALNEQGDGARGIAEMHSGLAVMRTIGAETDRWLFIGSLVDASVRADHVEDALALFESEAALTEKLGRCYFEAEIYRAKGELAMAAAISQRDARFKEAEACFRAAIEVARRQEAKSLELRATRSLCRLLSQEGRGNEAAAMLREICAWFTEGADTRDLIEARRLLGSL